MLRGARVCMRVCESAETESEAKSAPSERGKRVLVGESACGVGVVCCDSPRCPLPFTSVTLRVTSQLSAIGKPSVRSVAIVRSSAGSLLACLLLRRRSRRCSARPAPAAGAQRTTLRGWQQWSTPRTASTSLQGQRAGQTPNRTRPALQTEQRPVLRTHGHTPISVAHIDLNSQQPAPSARTMSSISSKRVRITRRAKMQSLTLSPRGHDR